MRALRAAEWKALGLGGVQGIVVAKEKKSDAVARAAKHAEQRRATQDQYEQQYQAALGNIKQKLQVRGWMQLVRVNAGQDVEGPDMREHMSDKIRQWFISCRDQARTMQWQR